MINVAFLLLVFFMMVAVIAPPDPFEIEVPKGSSEATAEHAHTIFVGPRGTLARGDHVGDAVFDGISGATVILRADADLDGALLAKIVARLTDAGVASVSLATRPTTE